LRYEELCNSPEISAKCLFEFLDLEFNPYCLENFNKFSTTRNLNKVKQPKLVHSIQNTWINRWQDPKHREIVYEFLKDEEAIYFLEKSGYSAKL
jgi:hypothetical protein